MASGNPGAVHTGSAAWTLGAAVANSELATMANNTFKGNVSGSTAVPADLTPAQVTAALPVATTSAKGLAPVLPNNASLYYDGTGNFTLPPGTTVPLFDSAASAAAASSTSQHIMVVDESAQAAYAYDPSTTSAATITNAVGRKYRNIEKVLTPKMFGAVGNGIADDTAALAALAAEIQWRGTGRVEFEDNKNYLVWTSVPSAGSSIMSFNAVKKLAMNFNGSKISIPINFASNAIVVYGIIGTDCENISIYNPQIVQTAYTTLDSAKGTQGIYLVNACRGIEVHDFLMPSGGVSGFSAVRNNANKGRDMFMSGEFTNVYYPASFQRSGDQAELRYKAINSGRSYFPYNVRQHQVTLYSQNGGTFDDCLLKVYANNAESNENNTLSDIDLHYINPGRTVVAGTGSIVRLAFDQWSATPAAGFIRNIKIRFDVDTGSQFHPPLIATGKYLSNSSFDTGVARGHIMSNIEFSGFVNLGTQNTTGMELFTTATGYSGGDFSLETVENITFRNFSQYGASATMNMLANCVTRNLRYENAFMAGTTTYGTIPAKRIDFGNNVSIGAVKSFGETGTPGSAGYQAYRRQADGGIHCWGLVTATGAANTSVTFPIAFSAIPTVVCSSTAGGTTSPVNAVSATTSGFQVNNPGTSVVVAWSATGYL
ncbi:gp53-like domain-containing protein [Bradyrhizobium elkanii]|uniref:gp53-like domain-containing protein n=1 Tax=Bradyrhizobium elkanii TaxID=29448 RepID=UPI001449C3F5|nr:hypothetical protein [Bradyrhizobium elkanii]MCS3576952.1 hypothetical protein [Bradyrhizobium elkanii]MCS3719829.1 hypothetical protein [Bradyrhizobium elkanii]MCS4004246.1 hypothetical protein [Bradyrhizobium elkanii USDA 61]BBB99407.1 hypothetical protein BE61_48520 [Bradyrhizobium elkanii USDA 61]